MQTYTLDAIALDAIALVDVLQAMADGYGSRNIGEQDAATKLLPAAKNVALAHRIRCIPEGAGWRRGIGWHS